jgi:phosphatidylglycerophosphate synthase
MLKNSEYFPTSTENKGRIAILFLSPPAGKGEFVDWYWRKIAGVPFLLRNILNIQRGGVERIALMTGKNFKAADELSHRLLNDPRVTLKLDWPSDYGQLAEITNGAGDLLFLDGTVLHDKNKIRSAVLPGSESEDTEKHPSFWLDKGSMALMLGEMEPFNFSVLEQAPDSEKQLLVYFPQTDHLKISSAKDFLTAGENIIQKSGGLTNDSFVTRVLSRPVSKRLTRLLLNTRITPNQITIFSFFLGLLSALCFLNTRITPNQITIFSFFLGLLSALCFFQGGYGMGVGGAGLLLLSIWVDGVDGEIARIKFMESPFGAKLDILCDNVVHVVVFFSIGRGLYHTLGETVYLILGGLAAFGSLLAFILLGEGIIAGKSTTPSSKENDRKKSGLVDKLANRDFTHFLFVLALLDQLWIFIWLTAIGSNLMALYILISSKLLKR